MDGYIKNKQHEISELRKCILYKYSIVLLIILFACIFAVSAIINQPPEEWKEANIEFSHISHEKIGLRRGVRPIMHTQDGNQFVIQSKLVSPDFLSESILPGNAYSVVYSQAPDGYNHLEAISDSKMIYQSLDYSISQWKAEQDSRIISSIVSFLSAIVAVIIIDKLWCVREHEKIRKLKSDIQRRKARI